MLIHTRYGNPFRRLLLAPENGPSGGNPGPKPTIEDRLATAEQARDQYAKERDEAKAELAGIGMERNEAKAESTRLSGLFEAATKAASDAQTALKTAQDSLATVTGERDALTGKLKTADENVARLETLCGLKGIDAKNAVPSRPPGSADKLSTADFQARYDAAKTQTERDSIRAELEKAAAEGRLA